ncbi:hypothetical protein [Duodenibacillus massiliensis]|uniref:hypothetical protein n=1 Tax=Duodenibacillus massiliensis TaxID=1852381 RepID=UPI002FDA3288
MSCFKDMVARDALTVFMNMEEFAGLHEINGRRLRCIIDTNEADTAPTMYEGVYTLLTTVYVLSSEMRAPAVDEILTIDGVIFVVKHVSDEDGLIVIKAERKAR